MPGYTIELDLTGRRALVVGLGRVGRRKAAGLVEAGALVLVVDPGPSATDPPPGVEVRAEPYRADHLRGAALAIAAAPAAINRRVVADAKARGIWVSSASEPASGDFAVPATWRDGPVTLTVSTAGASPALAAVLRDRAAAALGPGASGLARLLAELRPRVLALLPDPEARRRLLTTWADPLWLDLWASAGPDAVLRELNGALARAVANPRGVDADC
ncbi:MAG TPA: bifunctional precorrin-2 dehydrogenase/sirohydrochlorin ferrochelatase [Isosphaeraceae bacterium]